MGLRSKWIDQVGNANAILIALVAIAALLVGYMVATKNSEKELADAQKLNNHSSIDLSFLKELSFSDPVGQPITFHDTLTSRTIVNFWATWCAPCRREMPALQAFHDVNQASGVTVVGMTLDDPEPTERFIQELGISYPIIIMADEGWEISSKVGNPKGLLPYTLLVDEKGSVLEAKLGVIHTEDLENWLKNHPIAAK